MAEDVAFTLKTLSTTRKVLSGLSPKTVLRGIVVACRSSNKPEEVGVTGVQMEDPPPHCEWVDLQILLSSITLGSWLTQP